jgi:hypothetical protein
MNSDCLEIRKKFDEAMFERVSAENALPLGRGTEKFARFEKAKMTWEHACRTQVGLLGVRPTHRRVGIRTIDIARSAVDAVSTGLLSEGAG